MVNTMMKFVVLSSLLISLTLPDLTCGGSCLLKASVRVGNDNLKPQTQLQLLCNKTHNCSVTTTFDSCNIYDALEIDSDCVGTNCSRTFTISTSENAGLGDNVACESSATFESTEATKHSSSTKLVSNTPPSVTERLANTVSSSQPTTMSPIASSVHNATTQPMMRSTQGQATITPSATAAPSNQPNTGPKNHTPPTATITTTVFSTVMEQPPTVTLVRKQSCPLNDTINSTPTARIERVTTTITPTQASQKLCTPTILSTVTETCNAPLHTTITMSNSQYPLNTATTRNVYQTSIKLEAASTKSSPYTTSAFSTATGNNVIASIANNQGGQCPANKTSTKTESTTITATISKSCTLNTTTSTTTVQEVKTSTILSTTVKIETTSITVTPTLRPTCSETIYTTTVHTAATCSASLTLNRSTTVVAVQSITTIATVIVTQQTNVTSTTKSCPTSPTSYTGGLSAALGTLSGVFLVLLVLVTTGWVWTCWTMKKRGGMKVTSRENNFPNTLAAVNTDYNSDTLRRVQNPVYEETAASRDSDTLRRVQIPVYEETAASRDSDTLRRVQNPVYEETAASRDSDTLRRVQNPVYEETAASRVSQTHQREEQGIEQEEEVGPTYEIIPLAVNVNRKTLKNNQRNSDTTTTQQHHQVGECVTETQALGYESTYSLLGFESKDSVSPHHQENRNGSRKTKDIKKSHHHNSKAAATVDRHGATQRENEHQASDEEEGISDKDHIYFVLESPTTKPPGPVKADRERQEVSRERQEVERQEVEDAAATPYEIPIALYNTKKNKQNTVVNNTGTKNTDRS